MLQTMVGGVCVNVIGDSMRSAAAERME